MAEGKRQTEGTLSTSWVISGWEGLESSHLTLCPELSLLPPLLFLLQKTETLFGVIRKPKRALERKGLGEVAKQLSKASWVWTNTSTFVYLQG